MGLGRGLGGGEEGEEGTDFGEVARGEGHVGGGAKEAQAAGTGDGGGEVGACEAGHGGVGDEGGGEVGGGKAVGFGGGEGRHVGGL